MRETSSQFFKRRRPGRPILAGLLAVAAAAPSAAQAPAGQAPGHWVVNGSEHFCSLTRTTRDPDPITFSLRVVPGEFGAELILVSADWQTVPLRNLQEVELWLDPAGTRFVEAPRTGRLLNRDPVVAFLSLSPAFVDAFAEASAIRIARGGETRIAFTFRQSDRAVAALRECISFTLGQWGIDEAALAALSQQPRIVRPWITSDDYPMAELRAGLDGGVTVRLSLDADGRITDCRVVASSGHEGFDRNTCAAALDGGRYSPALDASGQPVAIDMAVRIRFQLAF